MKKHIIIGIAAGVSLLLVYSLVLVLAQGSGHALEQTARLWYWLAPLDIGFGIQIGLFSFLRESLRERRKKAATVSVAASGGVSAGSMVACCAHHLTEITPLIGLSGVAAFLTTYQVFFMIVGILANAIGITIMLDTIQRLGLCPMLARSGWNLGLVKRLAMVSAVIIVPVAFLTIK